MMKKRTILWGMLSFLSLALFAQVPTLTVQDLVVAPGDKEATVTIVSDVPLTDFCAYQFDLAIPTFLTPIESYTVEMGKINVLIEAQNSEIIDDHDLGMTEQAAGVYRFMCYSTSNAYFVDGSSENEDKQTVVLTLDVNVDENATPGVYPMQILTEPIAAGDVTFALKLDKAEEGYVHPNVVAGQCKVTEKLEFTMTEAGYGTWIMPFDGELPEGLVAYGCEAVDGNTLVLVEAASLKANVPYILAGEAGTYTFTGAPGQEDDFYSEGLLTGVYVDTPLTSGYVLQDNENGVGFYKVNSEKPVTITPNHCYLNLSAPVTSFFGIGGFTAIRPVITPSNGVAHDLSGKKAVEQLKGGLIIRDGKKYFVK